MVELKKSDLITQLSTDNKTYAAGEMLSPMGPGMVGMNQAAMMTALMGNKTPERVVLKTIVRMVYRPMERPASIIAYRETSVRARPSRKG